MQKKNQNDLDDSDSSDDEDYVPPEEKGNKAEEQQIKTVDEEELTGIAALKNRKRNREIDDIFDLMNAEDPIKKAMNERKRQNTGYSGQLTKSGGNGVAKKSDSNK